MKIFVYNGQEHCFEAPEDRLTTFSISAGADGTLIKMSLPMVDIHGAWHCNMSQFQLQLPWKLQFSCAINSGMPYLAFFNREHKLRCAVATDDLVDDTDFTAALNQQQCAYDITIRVSGRQDFTLTVDRREETGFQASLADWRRSVMPEKPVFPAGAWEPVFCSWYAVHGEVTGAWIESQAKKVRALGFSTFIVDDGWCYDEFKRVTPETLVNWYNTIGDWEVSKVKFPDFKEHVKRMQKLGFKYLLWVAPHFLGVDSELYRQHQEWAHEKVHEGCSHLKTADREAVDAIAGKLLKLAGENGLDGLKIDFLDIVLPSAAAPVGRNTAYLIEKMCSALRRDPEHLIEFRQGYATVGMLPYGTQFRAGDVPFDWALNFRRMADIRLSVGDGVPVHADPAYWSEDEYPVNVARHMMVMLMGVPMLSMDVNTMPPEHLTIVKQFLDLYHAEKELLNHGRWQIIFSPGDVGAATVENDSEMLAIVNDSNLKAQLTAAAAGRKLTLLDLVSGDFQVIRPSAG